MTALDNSTYAVVRARLEALAADLTTRAERLNVRRVAVFGAAPTELAATVHVRTEHPCIPRDLAAVGDRLLLGYHVLLGLKSAVAVGDVFAELAITEAHIEPVPMTLLAGEAFAKDFREVFQYYKDARLIQLVRPEGRLLAAFQLGQKVGDVRVLRWARDGAALTYLDNRGEADYRYPPSHDFAWTRSTRENHVYGAHPHVNVLDTIFVECLGGDLTIKVENSTTTGAGILSEPVDDRSQGLDDAEIYYAGLENLVLLRIRPYRETAWRHFVYNKLTREAVRLDAIGAACQQLPEGQGLVFPGGCYLASGAWKVFPGDAEGMEFIRALRAPSGEDVLYCFYERLRGDYILLRYNLVARECDQPLRVNGFSLLDDGRLVVFRADPEAARLHALQVWRTPFCSDEHWNRARPAGSNSEPLATIGNRDLVRALSDLKHLGRLVAAQRPTRAGYEELLRQGQKVLDSFHWLGQSHAEGLKPALEALRDAADQAIGEFDKMQQLAAHAVAQVDGLDGQLVALRKRAALTSAGLDEDLALLLDLRRLRGQIETARSLRHVDAARLDAVLAGAGALSGQISDRAVARLLEPSALTAQQQEVAALDAAVDGLATVVAVKPLSERLVVLGDGLDLLVETINGLQIADATARTGILERIAGVYGAVNRVRARLAAKRQELATGEGAAAFAASTALLAQAVANAATLADSPLRCDELLGKLLVQLEELEGRFADHEGFLAELAVKRDEIHQTFATRKQQLADAKARRADGVKRALDRVLESVARRALSFASADELNAWFAGDPLVLKARDLIAQLRSLDAVVAADDGEAQLRTARDHGQRKVRDRSELGADGGVRLGRHAFSVNTEAMELALLPREDDQGRSELRFQVTGTDYLSPVADAAFQDTREFWDSPLPSEDARTTRAEYLAWLAWNDPAGRTASADAGRLVVVARLAAAHHDHGYERGVHDADAVRILAAVAHLSAVAGLLRFPPAVRALGLLAWGGVDEATAVQHWRRQCRIAHHVRRELGDELPVRTLAADLAAVVAACSTQHGLGASATDCAWAARYLVEELGDANEPRFAQSGEAHTLAAAWRDHCAKDPALAGDLAALRPQLGAAWRLLLQAMTAFAARHQPGSAHAVPEACAWLLVAGQLETEPVEVHARTRLKVSGLLGLHPTIHGGVLTIAIDEWLPRLEAFAERRVPAFRAYEARKHTLLSRERERLGLAQLKPKVLTSFVRNRLVDEVYLPLIGDNLAKQMGALGAGRRTDLMGMLLLISPPGYGKTTLMEYIASVLGLGMVKVNAPALGHEVTGLDPAAAPTATARAELERLNLAFALGNNICLLIDDIQHSSPEFLQKFIPLCDGTRRIEGVIDGKPRTFDLRGKRFVVVMAGNPYTESGERFRIPDMLANRADTWNLGDVLGGHQEAFALSYLENCLTSNAILQPLASRPRQDLFRLLRLAQGDETARGELEHPYAAAELADLCVVLTHLHTVQQTLLTVNATYIASAAQADAYRTEPPFKLQGSYRNMAKVAARIVPAMTAAEARQVLLDHYRAEAQTLTTGAEANLLKLHELLGALDDTQRARWAEITKVYRRRQETDGSDDPTSKAVVQLAKLAEGLQGLRDSLAVSRVAADDRAVDLVGRLEQAIAGLAQALATAKSGGEAPKIEIINTLPKYYANLYQHHTQVIEQTLVPLVDALGRHLGTSEATRTHLAAIAADLRGMMERNRTAQQIERGDDGRVE